MTEPDDALAEARREIETLRTKLEAETDRANRFVEFVVSTFGVQAKWLEFDGMYDVDADARGLPQKSMVPKIGGAVAEDRLSVELVDAMEPFLVFARRHVAGNAFDIPADKERLRDWFLPGTFRILLEAVDRKSTS